MLVTETAESDGADPDGHTFLLLKTVLGPYFFLAFLRMSMTTAVTIITPLMICCQ